MKIIYHCYGGAHSSVVAAALHLGQLPPDRMPGPEELVQLPFFDRQRGPEHGYLRLVGIDAGGNEVYIIGRRNNGWLLEKLYYHLMDLFSLPREELYLANMMPCVNWYMVVGGFLSRRLGLTWPGRAIVARGAARAYFSIAARVERIKVELVAGGRREEKGGSRR